MEKKLRKIRSGKCLCGVCGGLAQYLEMDATLVRVLWVVISLIAGAGVLGTIIYFLLAMIIPFEE